MRRAKRQGGEIVLPLMCILTGNCSCKGQKVSQFQINQSIDQINLYKC